MCGIFGYVGAREDAGEITLKGLKVLEYRGYDSWGIATKVKMQKTSIRQDQDLRKSKNGSTILFEKHAGKIGDAKINLPDSSIGIGHTRWATHGKVTQVNAHPHLSCDMKIAVIHNGIVENFQQLKESLSGHDFKSETDTEVISHLIEDELKEKDLLEAVKSTFKKLTGLNAIVVLGENDEIVVAKKGSPLALGLGKDEYFLASDPTAILLYTKNVIFMEDDQIAILNKYGMKVFDLNSDKEITPEVQTLDWEIEENNLGEFKHFMLKEIFEQPLVVLNIAKNYKDISSESASVIKDAKGTFFIGCGSASYASLTGQYLFSSISKKHVNFAIGSEFNYLEHYLNKGSLVIAISQSGETIDVVEPVTNAKNKGAKIMTITNALGSSLYRLANEKILLGAGPEVGVCATKSFTSMVSVLIYLSYQMIDEGEKASNLLVRASENIRRMLSVEYLKKIKILSKKLSMIDNLYLIGRGLSYPLALESALKLKEVTYIHAEGFAGGELKHGVIALMEKDTPVIVFAPLDETYPSIISNAIEIKARGGYIIGISPKDNEVFDFWFPVDDLEVATLIPSVVISQLLSYYIALEKGLDPDKPRNLAKSVTVK